MTKRFFKLVVAYNGQAYVGWQVQPTGRSIQAEIETALEQITQERTRVTASGRTDSGVHALGQAVSFASSTLLPPAKLQRALNGVLPKDIRVLDVSQAPDDFHAIRDAISKRYRYLIQDGSLRDPFMAAWCWHLPQVLDQQPMQEAASWLVGEHDFASYQSTGSPRNSTVRTIYDFTVTRQQGPLSEPIVIEVSANGFLYNMVRNLVGTLAEIGMGKQSPAWAHEILSARDRKIAGPTAPAQGLFLVSVEYPPG